MIKIMKKERRKAIEIRKKEKRTAQ